MDIQRRVQGDTQIVIFRASPDARLSVTVTKRPGQRAQFVWTKPPSHADRSTAFIFGGAEGEAKHPPAQLEEVQQFADALAAAIRIAGVLEQEE